MTQIIQLGFAPQLAGRYKMRVRKAVLHADGSMSPGRVMRETPWFDNLITDAGLNMIGDTTINPTNSCQVGTGSATPTNSDTQLQARVFGTNSVTSSSQTAQTSAPYYGSSLKTFRFTPGQATGNISEVGIGKGPLLADTLFSRALVLDGGGSPTTITVLSDEYLDVAYELRCYPPLTDDVASVTINGTSFTFTTRACAVTDTTWWASGVGLAFNTKDNSPLSNAWFTGVIGAITAASPSGVKTNTAFSGLLAYSANSLRRDVQSTSSLSSAFTAKSFLGYTNYGAYQVGISPDFTKTNSQIASITMRVAWARKTLP